MKAKNLQEVVVYKKSQAAARAVSALLKRPEVSRDFDLKGQLSRSSRRVPPLIAEGFGQLTDRHVASYLGRARGSVQETIGHLEEALEKRYLTASECSTLVDQYDHIGRMLTRWINHLRESDWTDRR